MCSCTSRRTCIRVERALWSRVGWRRCSETSALLAGFAKKAEQRSKMWGCRKLVVAAAWADAHSEVDHPGGGVLVERLLSIGPVGTPLVAEFALKGLIGPYGTSTASARS